MGKLRFAIIIFRMLNRPLPPVDYDAKARASRETMEKLKAKLKGVDLKALLAEKLSKMSDDDRREALAKLEHAAKLEKREKCRLDYAEYRKEFWPGFVHGPHFDVLTKVYHRIAAGEAVRIIVNIPPRHGKSEDVSALFPSWFIGKFPEKKIIQVMNVMKLAEDFGGKVRNYMDTEEYKHIFPGVKLSSDSKAKGKFTTNKGGSYFAVGVGGTLTGRGGGLFIIDDPHTGKEGLAGADANELPEKDDFDKVFNWYTTNRFRLQPNGSIIIVMQRWAAFDLTGRLLERAKLEPNGDQWEVITMPAVLEKVDEFGHKVKDEKGEPVYTPLFPNFWPIEELLKLKATSPPWKWNAMFLQEPAAKEGAIIRREYWKIWGKREDGTIDDEKAQRPPICDFVIQSWDMAATGNDRSNYSACITLGVFNATPQGERPTYNLIVLNAKRGRWEFPDLKKEVIGQYKKFNPDTCVVEAKSAGIGIVQELRRTGIPLMSYNPQANQYTAKNDKVARVNSVADMFHSGMVWIPPYSWAEPVIEEYAVFPNGQNDDYVDAMTQALIRFRQGGFIQLPTDEEETVDDGRYSREVKYY